MRLAPARPACNRNRAIAAEDQPNPGPRRRPTKLTWFCPRRAAMRPHRSRLQHAGVGLGDGRGATRRACISTRPLRLEPAWCTNRPPPSAAHPAHGRGRDLNVHHQQPTIQAMFETNLGHGFTDRCSTSRFGWGPDMAAPVQPETPGRGNRGSNERATKSALQDGLPQGDSWPSTRNSGLRNGRAGRV